VFDGYFLAFISLNYQFICIFNMSLTEDKTSELTSLPSVLRGKSQVEFCESIYLFIPFCHDFLKKFPYYYYLKYLHHSFKFEALPDAIFI